MKTIGFKNIVRNFFCGVTLLLVAQCTSLEEKVLPIVVEPPSYPTENTSIAAVWERVQQSETGFVKFEDEEELWLSAFVSSSDAGGNFYKELYVQDTPSNAVVGLRLLLDQAALHTTYPPGRKILIRLNGLGAGLYKGVLSLGSYQADGVANLQNPLIAEHFIRTEVQESITPLPISLDALDETKVGLLISLEGVQFARSTLGKTFAGEAFDVYDGERRLVACENYWSIELSTSTFSKFKSIIIDAGSGTIQGILTRDYYNEKYILKVNYPGAIVFEGSRCDPFFEESFETVPLGRFEGAGWQNYAEAGTQYWEVYEDENSLGQSLRIGSYRSGDAKTICWLLSPPIDTASLAAPQLDFRTSTAYADGSVLEMLISEDYNGTASGVETATWILSESSIATEDDTETLWVDSGRVALDTLKTPFYVAFRYTGSGRTSRDGTYELDDIRVLEGRNNQ